MITDRLMEALERQEGLKLDVYRDPAGYWTCGIGCLISMDKTLSEDDARAMAGAPWTEEEARDKCRERAVEAEQELLSVLPWFDMLPWLVQDGLIDMAYQMGVHGVLAFPKMLDALRTGHWANAEAEALRSLWAQQTPERARDVAAWIGNRETA